MDVCRPTVYIPNIAGTPYRKYKHWSTPRTKHLHTEQQNNVV